MQTIQAFISHALNAVDAKGRVSVPASFRGIIDQRLKTAGLSGDHTKGGELQIGPHREGNRLRAFDAVGTGQLIDEISAGIADLPSAERREALNKARRVELGSLLPVAYDGAGRMVLPPVLRKEAGIGDTALFLGIGDYFEIWDPQAAREALADEPTFVRMIDHYLGGRGV